MGEERHYHCEKAEDISAMKTDLANIKKVVMIGNGFEALVTSVPKLATNVDDLTVATRNLDKTVKILVDKQNHYEGEREGKAEIRRRNRWLVVLGITIILSLLSGIITMGVTLSNMSKEIQKIDTEVTK